MTKDEKYIARCIQLASNGICNTAPNPMVGAVIVHRDTIIGEGYHIRCGEAHAEVNAIRSVKDERLLKEATIYVSLEPCSHYGKTPPCSDLIIEKGIPNVVIGCMDPFSLVAGRGIQKLRNAGINVAVGVLEKECQQLIQRFVVFNTLHRPFITLKWAESADGFIDRDFQPAQISNSATLMLSHKLRAEEDAILVGRVTDERDHPQLTVREWWGPNPKRLVIDHAHPLNLESLHSHQIQSLIVEGGARTLQSFLDKGLWDELRVETNFDMTVSDGTRAPLIPAEAVVKDTIRDGANQLVCYEKIIPEN